MRPRTLFLFATPAVIAAMSVAVPALAGSSSSGRSAGSGAKASAKASAVHAKASTGSKKSKPQCVYTGKGKQRTRVCAFPGAPGQRGPRGFVGPHGKRGLAGAAGTTGPTGAAGTAHAYAVVSAKSPAPEFVPGQTHEFTSVRRVSGPVGVYCLTPASSINPGAEPAVVSGESAYSNLESGAVPLAVVNASSATGANPCNGNEYKVETFALGEHGPKPSDDVAFSIAVP
jgi:hypothetical protein